MKIDIEIDDREIQAILDEILHHAEHLVVFSCKRRGFCPSCGARRMAESAALLVDEVLPEQPMRQWVLSFPLRFLFARRPEIMGRVLGCQHHPQMSFFHRFEMSGFQRFCIGLTKPVTVVISPGCLRIC